ncbi:serine hydrolase domain-containing protein [Arcticibacter eurypsychrophilus]|uniref:serine hydrolase domain-containing protein n=1 Tax=Arcticibacter eurypsychrophilus TaxID=1434752 RepID=UPI00084E0099|nr:serine hydrolase domain-containing protein [Arcticibacter eurypsychrophilus]
MTRKSLFVTILLFSSLAFSFCSSEKKKEVRTVEDDKSDSLMLVYDPKKGDVKIDEFMQTLHKKRGFNGNVLVAKKGKIIYQNAIGWADYLHRDSLNINSQFELASLTKTMTGTAILILAEKGKLKLDQTVNDFFPEFPYPGITIRMLLSHRSGMMNYVYFVDGVFKAEKKSESKGISNQDVMKLIAEKKPSPYTRPNVKFHYNNSNFMVLGAIIEKVSGMRYSQFMMENVFKPAGMHHTAVYSKAEYETIPVDVVGHDRTWRYSVVQNFLDGPVGDKGVYSTVQDLFLFDRALRKGNILSKAWQDSAYTAHNELSRGHFSYGYGWRTFDGKGEKVVYHTGWWHGFRHIYLRDLKSDVTIVLLSNLTNGSLLQLDDLYKLVGMPVVRKSAYHGNGDSTDE